MIKYLRIDIPNTLSLEFPNSLKQVITPFDVRYYIEHVELNNPRMVPYDNSSFLDIIDTRLQDIEKEKNIIVDLEEISHYYEAISAMLWTEIYDFSDLILDHMTFYRYVDKHGVILTEAK